MQVSLQLSLRRHHHSSSCSTPRTRVRVDLIIIIIIPTDSLPLHAFISSVVSFVAVVDVVGLFFTFLFSHCSYAPKLILNSTDSTQTASALATLQQIYSQSQRQSDCFHWNRPFERVVEKREEGECKLRADLVRVT